MRRARSVGWKCRYVQHRRLRNPRRHVLCLRRPLRYPVHTMTNYFASSLLDAMGKVLHLHTGTCQYLDRETGELMWLVGASRYRRVPSGRFHPKRLPTIARCQRSSTNG